MTAQLGKRPITFEEVWHYCERLHQSLRPGFYLGFPVILAIAYTVMSVEDVVAGDLGQPMGALCLQVLGPKAGLAMFCINIVAQWAVELGCIIAGSRVSVPWMPLHGQRIGQY